MAAGYRQIGSEAIAERKIVQSEILQKQRGDNFKSLQDSETAKNANGAYLSAIERTMFDLIRWTCFDWADDFEHFGPRLALHHAIVVQYS